MMNVQNDSVHKKNLTRYNDTSVVDYYAQLLELEPYEKGLFEKYIPNGARVLDIGVGGGRTTPWLAARSESYLGIDYAFAMVEVCRGKFPDLRFEQMDATDLSAIASASVDVVVFSFNGIDHIHPAENRAKCLLEVNRVLAPTGLFIFSEHNARQVIVKPKLHGVGLYKRLWRILRATVLTVRRGAGRVWSPVFRAGFGYETDPVHGGLVIHSVIPAIIGPELLAAGFKLVETAGVEWPGQSHPLVTPWYYFVARKAGRASGAGAS